MLSLKTSCISGRQFGDLEKLLAGITSQPANVLSNAQFSPITNQSFGGNLKGGFSGPGFGGKGDKASRG